MDLLPSNIDLSGRRDPAGHTRSPARCARPACCEPVLPEYDVILIDCQPSLGLLTVNALTCARRRARPAGVRVLRAARRGAADGDDRQGRATGSTRSSSIEGILATMYDSRTLHSREVLAGVVEAFGDKVFHTVITRTVRFPEATVAGEPITTLRLRVPGRELLPGARPGGAGAVAAGGSRGSRSRRVTPAGSRRAAPPRRAQPRRRRRAPGQRPGAALAEDHRLPVQQRAAGPANEPGSPCAATASPSTGAGSSARRWPSLLADLEADGETALVAQPPARGSAVSGCRRHRVASCTPGGRAARPCTTGADDHLVTASRRADAEAAGAASRCTSTSSRAPSTCCSR